MEVWHNNNSKIETCSACGYQHRTYFEQATDSDLFTDETKHRGTKPFIISTLRVAYSKDNCENLTHTVVYICPSCGCLQVEAQAKDLNL